MGLLDSQSLTERQIAVTVPITLEIQLSGEVVPRIPKTEFEVGGLRFEIILKEKARRSDPFKVFDNKTWTTALYLAEDCARNGMRHWSVSVQSNSFSKGAWKDLLVSVKQTYPLEIIDMNKDEMHTYKFVVPFQDARPNREHLTQKDLQLAAKRRCDCELLVDGQQLFAHKGVLAADSTFFHTLFFGPFREGQENIAEIEKATVDDVLEYLYCVYPPFRPLDFKRIEPILRLSDRFGNDILLEEAEKFLLQRRPAFLCDNLRLIEWAMLYRLPRLFEQIIEFFTNKSLDSIEIERCTMKLIKLLPKTAYEVRGLLGWANKKSSFKVLARVLDTGVCVAECHDFLMKEKLIESPEAKWKILQWAENHNFLDLFQRVTGTMSTDELRTIDLEVTSTFKAAFILHFMQRIVSLL